MKERLHSLAFLYVAIFITGTFVGCGKGPNTVITPGEGYQRTPAEQARYDLEESKRKEAEGER